MKSNRILPVFFLTVLLIVTATVSMIRVVSAPATSIFVSPSVKTNPGAMTGFAVFINVTDAPTTWAWEVHLTWDANTLELYGKQEGLFLSRGTVSSRLYSTTMTTYPDTSVNFNLANAKGELQIGCTMNTPGDPWATGNGYLVRLSFRFRTSGGSTLVNLFDTSLLDHLEAGSPAPTLYPNLDGFFYSTPPIHDVSGRSRYIKPLNMTVNVGQVAKINVTVLNEGTASQSITLNLKANGTQIGTTGLTLYGTTGLGGSFENRSKTYTFNWDTTGFATGKYNITASVPAVSGETDTADNNFAGEQLVRVLPKGDLNRDGIVDSGDLTLLADAYGSTSTGGPPWDPVADINKNNKVEVLDLYILGRDYGKSVP